MVFFFQEAERSTMNPPHKCKHCAEKFPTEEKLCSHISAMHNDSLAVYTCEICQKQFQYKGSYTDHLRSHSKDDIRYECTDCPCFFKNHGHLKSHIKVVHGVKRQLYQCKECSKKFDSKAPMIQHMRTVHTSVQVMHKCTFCQRLYGSANSLKWHIHINHNKDYVRSKCPYCPCDFKWPHHLKVHIKKTHIANGQAPTDLLKKGLSSIRRKENNCIVCHEKFEKKLDLMLHLKSAHKQELDIYKCCRCTAVFTLKNSLKFHLDEHQRKNTGPGNHRCQQCHPEPNPILYKEEKSEVDEYDERSEIEKEVIDFELTLMEDEDIRQLIRYRLKHAKRKYSTDQEMVFKDIKELDLLANGVTNNISDDVSSEYGVDSLDSTKSSVNGDTINGKIEVEHNNMVCLVNVTPCNLALKEEKQCNVCNSKFKFQHSLHEHKKLCHKADEPQITMSSKDSEILEQVSNELPLEKVIKSPTGKVNTQKNYKCKLCKEKFKKPINLGRHVRLIHRQVQKATQTMITGAQKYKSDSTSKRSKKLTNRNMKSKVKLELETRMSKAPEKQKSGIAEVKHVNMKADAQKLYECGKCVLYFKSKLDLLRHISGIHMGIQPRAFDSYFCDNCNSKFPTKEQLQEHLKSH